MNSFDVFFIKGFTVYYTGLPTKDDTSETALRIRPIAKEGGANGHLPLPFPPLLLRPLSL